MKSIKIAALFLCSSAIAFAQDITVKGTSKLNIDFTKYKTYSWALTDETVQNEEGYEIYSYAEEVPVTKTGKKTPAKKDGSKTKSTGDRYVYSYSVIIPASNPGTNTTIQKSITEELEGRGYHKNQTAPDLLVSYKVLERKAKLRGYKNDDPTVVGATEVRQPEDTVTYSLEPGTLIISLIDSKTSQGVWDGFASGLIKDNTFTPDPVKIKEAVHLIFDEYKYRADKVTAATK
jgi:hypothetical protein